MIEDAVYREVLALTNEHAWLLDHGKSNEIFHLYTHDGCLLNLPPKDLLGRDAIKEWGVSRVKLPRVSRHVETNHRVFREGDSIRGTIYISVYRAESIAEIYRSAPLMVGDYEDTYAYEDGMLKIKERKIVGAFRERR
jgi:hypothetical protein